MSEIRQKRPIDVERIVRLANEYGCRWDALCFQGVTTKHELPVHGVLHPPGSVHGPMFRTATRQEADELAAVLTAALEPQRKRLTDEVLAELRGLVNGDSE